jgi:tetratricopeptide (TPR) repeat protein
VGRFFALLLFLFLGVGLSPHDLRAADAQPSFPSAAYDLHYTKGLFSLNQKKYPEAIEELNKALVVKPNERDASYYLGVALNKAGRNKEAEEILRKVVALDPNFEKVHFDLGVVEYELGKYPEALQELGRAEKADPNNALVYYYQGLADYHLGDYARSSPQFLRAVALAPDLGLTAHFYAGIGYYHQGSLAEAKDEFEEAIRIDPSSSVAKSAQKMLDQLQAPANKAKRWDVQISMAYQYDSNVILLAGGSPPPTGISRKWDNSLVFYVKGGLRFLDTADWTIGSSYAFYQNLHEHLTSFNVQNHEGSVFLLYRRPWGQVRIPSEFNLAMVDGDTYLLSYAITPTVKIPESPVTFTEIRYGYTAQNFKNTAQFPSNSHRDGDNHMAGIAQSVVLDHVGRLRIGYNYDRELTGSSPTQDDWAYQGHRILGELKVSLPKGLGLDLGANYYIQDYDNPNSYSSPPNAKKRTDHIQTYSGSLSKTLGEWITVSVQYLYNRNGSNIPVFDFDRNLVSVIVAGNF